MSPGGPIHSDRLRDRVAVVFGGGAARDAPGVGQAVARGYGAAGARVAIFDREFGNAQRTAELIEGSFPGAADVTDEQSVRDAITQTVERFGRIDILHNNVGTPVTKRFEDYRLEDWTLGFGVNCIAAATAMRVAMPHLIASGGAIVNVSSVASIRHTGINYAVYSAAKAALDQVTAAVAIEFASRGVRANSILPGLLNTPMGQSFGGQERDQRSPTGRQGDVWDVANAAVFLASDDARYINGHMLVVDGGLSRQC